MRRLFLSQDSIVDRLAKLISPDDCVNWHSYRPLARGYLMEIGVQTPAEEFDREITHEELREYRAAMPKTIPSW